MSNGNNHHDTVSKAGFSLALFHLQPPAGRACRSVCFAGFVVTGYRGYNTAEGLRCRPLPSKKVCLKHRHISSCLFCPVSHQRGISRDLADPAPTLLLYNGKEQLAFPLFWEMTELIEKAASSSPPLWIKEGFFFFFFKSVPCFTAQIQIGA